MFATTTVRFALVAAVLSSLTSAAPIFNLGRKEAVAMVRRAENDGQLAQGTNYFFTTLHLEDACAPGQVACVSGNYATCSGEGNWEITPCSSGSTCLATPASSPSGISIQCTSQESAQSSIQNAGGDPNSIAADFHVTDAPFVADTVADPSASSSASATATESSSAPADTASPTEAPTETASATETSESSTCTPDDEDDEGTVADGPTESASSSTPTETPSPTETCTEEEPIETETITVIVVPVPSQSGVYSTTTLFPEVPEPTVVGTDVPVPTDSSTEVPSATESSSESASAEPTESSSQDSSYTEPAATEASSSESAPTDSSSSSEVAAPTESSSSSESVATVTTIVIDAGYSIPALPTGAGGATTPVVIPVVSVVGTHNVPAAKRMARVRRA